MTTTKAKRARLTRERIVEAAVTHADLHGLASVTIRSLATDLGVHPMSLYHYFEGKDAILEAMIDVLLDEAPLPEVTSWQAWIEEVFATMRSLARSHPGAFEVVQISPASGRNADRFSDYGVRSFLAAGFSPIDAVTAVRSVSLAALGLSTNERLRALTTHAEVTARMQDVRATLPVDVPVEALVDVDLWGFTRTTLIAGLETALLTTTQIQPTRRTSRRKQEKT